MDPVKALLGVMVGIAALKAPPGVNVNKALTPAREQLFRSLMRSKGTPESIRAIADKFEGFGCPIEAGLLRKRSDSLSMPPEALAKRKDTIRAAFKCTDPAKVEAFADICEGEGMTTVAGNLRRYAAGLRKVAAIPPSPSKPTAATP